MEQLTALVTDNKIPVGRTAKAVFDWLNANAAGLFNTISTALDWLIGRILAALEAPHPLVFILLAVALTWVLQRNWKTCLLVVAGLLFVLNQGYWDEMMQSLTLVLAACLVCMAIGVPVGIAAAHRPRLYAWMRPVLDLMQTLPSFVYLIPVVVIFGIGRVPGLIAVTAYALPPLIRMTDFGLRAVGRDLREAAAGLGASDRQRLFWVDLPVALPAIMAGVNQTIMMALAMVVVASMVGVGGLGRNVLQAINNQFFTAGALNGLALVIIAIVFDRTARALGHRFDPAGAARADRLRGG